MNHHALYLAPCAFFGAVFMWPELQFKNRDYIMSLPAAERAQHLGRVVFLPASMTEAEHTAHNTQSVVVCVVNAQPPPTAAHDQVTHWHPQQTPPLATSGTGPSSTLQLTPMQQQIKLDEGASGDAPQHSIDTRPALSSLPCSLACSKADF